MQTSPIFPLLPREAKEIGDVCTQAICRVKLFLFWQLPRIKDLECLWAYKRWIPSHCNLCFPCFLISAVNQLAYNRLTTLCNKLEINDALVSVTCTVERFSIEGCKTKTKVITSANQNEERYHKEPLRSELRLNTCNQPEAWETWETKSRLVLVLHLIGWEGGGRERA